MKDRWSRGIASAGAAVILLTVLLGGTLVVIVDQAQVQGDQISSLSSELNSLHTGRSTTASTAVQGTNVSPTTRHVTLFSYPKIIQIAKGVNYLGWTFNGTVPGPTIFVNQGDTVVFTLINNSTMPHSMDFHAAEIDWATAYSSVAPGENKTFSFVANYPGVFMYHCGTPPVLEHIGNGMYGAIVVQPSVPLSAAPGGSYVIIESEFYISMGANRTYAGNYTKMLSGVPDYVVFNGEANQYMDRPLTVQPNQRVRLYLLNVGPTLWEAFHVIGAIMDTVYIDGNPANVMHGLQTLSLAPSSGAIVDMYFRDPGGKNPFVTHAFAYASKGAIGIFQVAGGSTSTTTSTSSEQGVTVDILNGAGMDTNSPGYSPPTITVVIGMNSTVTWVNQDTMPHTVTATDHSFDSGNLDAGKSFTFTFTLPGTYSYFCSYHSWMKGKVIVMAMH
jgi:nitrite reductase (NO-forming)